jgi:hypothetical protein
MPLLTDDLRNRLPPLNGQEAETDPVVYAKFFVPGTELAWYPIEGEPQGDDYLFFGWIAGSRNEFDSVLLSELEAFRGLLEVQRVECDPAFTAGRLTDVVPPPDL